jgi:uncharacterized protein
MIKFILIFAVVLACIWLWRYNREADTQLRQRKNKTTAPVLDMVPCALCAMHIPEGDAIQGKKGMYCCADHHHRAEP